jgi:hypothetical protein
VTDLVDEMCEDDGPANRPFDLGEELMWTQLDIRARELALKSALRAHGPTPGDRMTTSNIVFTARAFYDFLTGEHDADPTEQSQ